MLLLGCELSTIDFVYQCKEARVSDRLSRGRTDGGGRGAEASFYDQCLSSEKSPLDSGWGGPRTVGRTVRLSPAFMLSAVDEQ